jgi:hypothetical protein
VFEAFAGGSSVYYSGGQRQTYDGDIPPASPAAWANQTIHTQGAEDLLAVAIRGVYGDEPSAISLLDLHFAGADLSPLWTGYMDGAIRTGRAAADGDPALTSVPLRAHGGERPAAYGRRPHRARGART